MKDFLLQKLWPFGVLANGDSISTAMLDYVKKLWPFGLKAPESDEDIWIWDDNDVNITQFEDMSQIALKNLILLHLKINSYMTNDDFHRLLKDSDRVDLHNPSSRTLAAIHYYFDKWLSDPKLGNSFGLARPSVKTHHLDLLHLNLIRRVKEMKEMMLMNDLLDHHFLGNIVIIFMILIKKQISLNLNMMNKILVKVEAFGLFHLLFLLLEVSLNIFLIYITDLLTKMSLIRLTQVKQL